MNIFSLLYQDVLFRPIFNALFFLYNTISFQDFGIAIILLTICIRILLFPLFQTSIRAQKKMSEIQPDIAEIQNKYKDNKDEQAKRLMELYREKKVNPFSGCLPLIIQLPILIALYHVFLRIFDASQLHLLYSFISVPDVIHKTAFGFLNLSLPSPIIAFTAGLSQYLQALTMPQAPSTVPANTDSNAPDMTKILSYQTKYFFPFLIAFLSFSVPSALPLYWTVLNLFAIVQQKFIK